jgi:hypothetical protein
MSKKPAPSPAERMDDAEFERLAVIARYQHQRDPEFVVWEEAISQLLPAQPNVVLRFVAEARRARASEAVLRAALAERGKDLVDAADSLFKAVARADAAVARVETPQPLAAFGKAIIESYFNDGYFGDLDGGDVQEKAVELGLLVHPEVAHDPDDCEACHDEPRSCYVLSAAALEAKP